MCSEKRKASMEGTDHVQLLRPTQLNPGLPSAKYAMIAHAAVNHPRKDVNVKACTSPQCSESARASKLGWQLFLY